MFTFSMWRRTYLILLLIRLYFALSSSYIHPDENFQGPEVIAGQIFGYRAHLTWEFTSANPIRSLFPLWLVYGLPMLILRFFMTGNGNSDKISPVIVFWTLRVWMFTLSFILGDWALHELIQSSRNRKIVVLLVASSYVTWTYQTHTFSNSIETLTVILSHLLIQRITKINQKHSSTFASAILGFVVIFGLFNRISFPVFILIPGLQLIPHLINRPVALSAAILSSLITLIAAISLDTKFYTKHDVTWSYFFRHPVITPINNLKYNLSNTNLSQHGLHPWYQHLLFNLPQLIGPAFILIFYPEISQRFYSAISGIFLLSFIQHQEARFLLPTIPLLLSSINLPKTKLYLKLWCTAWVYFNVIFGILMGVYHQGGVIPAQLFLSSQPDASHAFWWKTYSPPVWLLDGKSKVLKTHDMMSIKGSEMLEKLTTFATCDSLSKNSSNFQKIGGTYLIAPLSATYLDGFFYNQESKGLRFQEMWHYRKHLNLDDLDFNNDGFWLTIQRVVGRRGIGVWRVTKVCDEINE